MELTVINEREQSYHTYGDVRELYVDAQTGDLCFLCWEEVMLEYFDITIHSNDYTSFRVNKG